MLTETTGDILKVKDGIICHQVNYHGVMGAGLAAALAKYVLPWGRHAEYVEYCHRLGPAALGTVQFLPCDDKLTVANLFCQDEGLATRGEKGITDYKQMRRCFARVRSIAILQGKKVYIPYKIGCGIAGGDWTTVHRIIQDVFTNWPVEAYIVERKG